MHRADVLLALVAALVAGSVAILVTDRPDPSEREATREFHHFVGGIGFGPAISSEGCEFDFDPRTCPSCPHDTGPLAGGMHFCPRHGLSVFAYPPLADGP